MRIAIVEDDTRYRESLETLFRHAPGFSFQGSYGSARPMLERLQSDVNAKASATWDILLMDIGLPDLTGVEATRRVKKLRPEALVVVLTIFEEPATILEAICAGADGYLLKKSSGRELLAQLRVVAAGGAPLTAGIARSVLGLLRSSGASSSSYHRPGTIRPRGRGPNNDGLDEDPDKDLDEDLDADLEGLKESDGLRLTERETEVLRCLTRGLAYKQTAAELGIALDTVRFHIRAVYRKLQVHSVAEAVGRAIRERLV